MSFWDAVFYNTKVKILGGSSLGGSSLGGSSLGGSFDFGGNSTFYYYFSR